MKFSIITCTYNSDQYLQANIDSVKNQTFHDFEHIFIDGFSSDKTVDIINKYQQDFPGRVKFFQFKPEGIANAMNKGIERACGEYINHLHSDDSFYANDVLEKVAIFIEKNHNPDLIYGKANFYNDKKSRIIPHRAIYKKLRFWLLLMTNYIPHQAAFKKKKLFDKFGMFDNSYKNSMDYEMWLRLSKKRISSRFINEIICNFSVRADSQSSIGKETYLEENVTIRQKYLRNKLLLKILSFVLNINSKRSMLGASLFFLDI